MKDDPTRFWKSPPITPISTPTTSKATPHAADPRASCTQKKPFERKKPRRLAPLDPPLSAPAASIQRPSGSAPLPRWSRRARCRPRGNLRERGKSPENAQRRPLPCLSESLCRAHTDGALRGSRSLRAPAVKVRRWWDHSLEVGGNSGSWCTLSLDS